MPPIRRGEIWFAATPGGDRPVLILTRDPVADRIGAAWTIRGAAFIMLGYTGWAYWRRTALRRLVVNGVRQGA